MAMILELQEVINKMGKKIVILNGSPRKKGNTSSLAGCSPRSRAAVEETAGQVLTYGEEIFDCFYSVSNGRTCRCSGEVWSRDYPYYINRPDPWDTAAREESYCVASHGVGLSQVGCMWAALHGVSYEEILAFYYSGTALARGYGLSGAAAFGEVGGESIFINADITYVLAALQETKNDAEIK